LVLLAPGGPRLIKWLDKQCQGQAARRPVCYLAAGAQIETCISGWETSAGIQPQAISALAARHD